MAYTMHFRLSAWQRQPKKNEQIIWMPDITSVFFVGLILPFLFLFSFLSCAVDVVSLYQRVNFEKGKKSTIQKLNDLLPAHHVCSVTRMHSIRALRIDNGQNAIVTVAQMSFHVWWTKSNIAFDFVNFGEWIKKNWKINYASRNAKSQAKARATIYCQHTTIIAANERGFDYSKLYVCTRLGFISRFISQMKKKSNRTICRASLQTQHR